MDLGDDAGVFQISDDIALVQTTDFFTPIVDDPFTFGQIAAANALSDVYAMGGVPLTALNLVGFPQSELPLSVLREILAGGLDKCDEAECAVLGGHSVRDNELKYGLAVTGRIHPARVRTKLGARPGDVLVLTKPIGTGVVTQAIKKDRASDAQRDAVVDSMRTLNRAAATILEPLDIGGLTDITGFGLAGHALQMLAGADVGFVLTLDDVPLFEGARGFVEAGVVPGGCKRNRAHYEPNVDVTDGLDPHLVTLLFDPQTSGGLLATVPAADARGVIEQLHDEGVPAAAIGTVTADRPGRLTVR